MHSYKIPTTCFMCIISSNLEWAYRHRVIDSWTLNGLSRSPFVTLPYQLAAADRTKNETEASCAATRPRQVSTTTNRLTTGAQVS